jgi:anti-anti-sigma factor
MAEAVSFSSDRIGDHMEVLTLDGSCDLPAALHAEQRIVSALDAGRTEIIFDLRGVTSLSAPMLHMLFRGLIRVKGQKGQLAIVRPNSHVWSRFEESGLERGFSTSPDLKGALSFPPCAPSTRRGERGRAVKRLRDAVAARSSSRKRRESEARCRR